MGTYHVILRVMFTGILERFVDSLFDLKKKFIRHGFKKSTKSNSMNPVGGLKTIYINTIPHLHPWKMESFCNLRHKALSSEVGLEVVSASDVAPMDR